ncbi:flagellar basal body P-ring formation chaperone FlgA [Janthinobacterium aquaticum]|uniref:flagellar basal body P-ring formation chaperone FlgA n=1 Tax=Janthinobacterium sp. FT58W TaxID=2654254 RepID=UPI00186B108C|nr:flagellar basal body P-ring formation chaperone FlgA [Janthinobacterium sp. FT58W]
MNYFNSFTASFRRPSALLPGLFLLTSLYSSAGRAELPADNIFLQVEQLAREHLAQQAASAGLLEPLFEITVVKNSRVIPPCAKPVAIEAQDSRSLQRMRFVASCPVPGGWRYEMLARAVVTAKVVVTTAPVTANTPLQAGDITLARRDVTLISDSVSSIPAVVAQSSRRSLRAGEVLREGQLASPVLVKSGSAVNIVAHREQIQVSMAGEAMDAGAAGEVIRVRNASSGTIIRARVLETGLVEPADIGGK